MNDDADAFVANRRLCACDGKGCFCRWVGEKRSLTMPKPKEIGQDQMMAELHAEVEPNLDGTLDAASASRYDFESRVFIVDWKPALTHRLFSAKY